MTQKTMLGIYESGSANLFLSFFPFLSLLLLPHPLPLLLFLFLLLLLLFEQSRVATNKSNEDEKVIDAKSP